MISPAAATISPVFTSTTSSANTLPRTLFLKCNFLLNLYLPTFARSYLLASKNIELSRLSALSTESGSPGLIFLYNSKSPSEYVVAGSLAILAISLGESPKSSNMALLLPTPKARISTVTGTLRVLSTRT